MYKKCNKQSKTIIWYNKGLFESVLQFSGILL